MKVKYLIIGNSAGGLSAAQAISEIEGQDNILILSDEPHPAYSRPALSELLSGHLPQENLYLKSRFNTLTGRKAIQIKIENKEVVLEDGERISYEKLLLATGSLPVIPSKWRGIEGVFTFNSLADAQGISRTAKPSKRAVVIGAGLIGISAVKALKVLGLEVFLVARSPRVFISLLDEQSSRIVEDKLREKGINLRTNSQGEEIRQKPLRVILGSGGEIPADLIVVGRGIKPRIELISGTPIKVEKGILVDKHMATNLPDIYACGDVAQTFDLLYGSHRLNANWVNAVIGGRVAGSNMAGKKAEFSSFMSHSLDIFGLPLISAGITQPPDGWEELKRLYDGSYIKIVIAGNKIKGFIMLGDVEKAGVILNLMKRQADISQIKPYLLQEDFGLSYLRRFKQG